MNLSDRGAAAPQQLAAALHSSAGGHHVDIGLQVGHPLIPNRLLLLHSSSTPDPPHCVLVHRLWRQRSRASQMCAGCCPLQRTWGGWSSTEQRCAQWYCSTAVPATLLLLCCTHMSDAPCGLPCYKNRFLFWPGGKQAQQRTQCPQQRRDSTGRSHALWHAAAGQVAQVWRVCGDLSVEGRVT